jgi:hypothetical protein
MHERAAEDVSRLLDKPGLRNVVEVAERAQADLDAQDAPNTAGTWAHDDDTKNAQGHTERRNASGRPPAQSAFDPPAAGAHRGF